MNNNIDLSALNTLSEKEKQFVIQLLQEASQGNTQEFTDFLYEDYSEIPVDIETFITDDNYLGKAWKDTNGKLKLYPFWLEKLKELFPNSTDTIYNTVLESGARGIGKSEIACGCICTYLMYRVMCLKNPLQYFHLKPTEKICFAFMNIKLELSEQIATDKFQSTIQASPWFMSKGRMTQKNNKPYWVPPEPIKIIIGSQSDDVIGLPIYFAFFDEISFIKNQDIDKQKKKAKDMIDTAVGGMVTRFTHQGKLPTVLAVASSKRSEQSFMEEYIKALSANDPEHTLVIDKPVWEIKPKETYLLTGQTEVETFYIALGNKFLESVVVPESDETEDKLDSYREKGYKLLKVPRFFKAKFLEDLERNLCDIAGISSSSANKYMSANAVKECIIEDFKNPFPDILTIGNAPDDMAQYQNFFNLENVPQELLSKPLCLHLDMSISGDMTGIAGVWIIGKKPSTQEGEEGKDLQFRLAFSTSIQAPKGRQVSFEKNRIFIRWLKSIGFNIKEITTDTFQSYDLRQILAQEGFNCSILSVDRCDSDRVCKPYQFLKNAVYEKRFFMFNSKRLFDEFVDVERNINTGKIDHTQNYHKDALDAVCGATYTCAKYAQEYAYDYGETYEIVTSTNIAGQASSAFQQQITVDFEQELKKVFGDFGLKNTENNCINNYQDNSLMYLEQGIIVL